MKTGRKIKPVDEQEAFGALVKSWRIQQGLSQEELAEQSGLHRTYVSDVERGVRNPSLKIIIRLAQALKISVTKLFPEELALRKTAGDPNQRLVRPVNILLVTDDPKTVEMTLQAFTKARFTNQIDYVLDGDAAFDYLYCHAKGTLALSAEGPHLILLDLGMPRSSGLNVLRRLKEDSRTARIPVIMLTCCSENADIPRCESLGATAAITKPVNWLGIDSAIEKLNWHLVMRQSPDDFEN